MQQLFKIAKRLLSIQLTTLYFFSKSPISLNAYEITLNKLQRSCVISAYMLIFLALWGATPSSVFAKGNSNEVLNGIPENASARSYGSGWNCNKGYRESEGACDEIIVPANAYATNKTYGKGWECKRSFLEVNNSCNFIKVPENAYLDYSGNKVKCDRGYLMVNKTCELIKVPANGFLDVSSYGPGWKCLRGYRADNGVCIALKIPENAHIGYSGKAWECNNPYTRKQNQCVLTVKN